MAVSARAATRPAGGLAGVLERAAECRDATVAEWWQRVPTSGPAAVVRANEAAADAAALRALREAVARVTPEDLTAYAEWFALYAEANPTPSGRAQLHSIAALLRLLAAPGAGGEA